MLYHSKKFLIKIAKNHLIIAILITLPVFCLTKDRFIFGYENDFGILNISHKQKITTFYGPSYLDITTKKSNGSIFSLGILGGYEFYFKDKPHMGVRIYTKLQTGYTKMQIITIDNTAISENKYNLTFDFLTIKTGIGVQYIWKFLNKKDFSIGILSGLNLDFIYFKSIAETINNYYGIDRPSFYNIGASPNIGLYLDFASTYLSLTYTLGPINFLSTYTHYPILSVSNKNFGEIKYFIENTINYSSFFSLGFGYKF